MHQTLDYAVSSSNVLSFNKPSIPASLMIVGGNSGYGHALRNYYIRQGWIVKTAGLSINNDYQIDLECVESVKELAVILMREEFSHLVVTAATAFLGGYYEEHGFDTQYMKKMHLNAFFLWTLCRQLVKLDYSPRAIVVFTSEAGWSKGPKTHLHYNISKCVLNSLVFNMHECYKLICIGVDPGEARTRMNSTSQRSPATVIPIIDWIFAMIECGKYDLAGRFFHADGRCLSFNKSSPLIINE